MTEKTLIQLGKKVRDFTLKDQNGADMTLSAYRGKKVLLSFHPLAWTSICGEQMKSLEKNRKKFEVLGTVALGISVDSLPCKAAWAKSLRIRHTPLLADFWPHGGVAKSLGIFRDREGFSQRANIIVDEKGTVMFIKVYPVREIPDIEEVLAALA
ncbi:MAG TPA: redoxin domain-containing protein [Deltaproteobacteria bacterium]|nr:redoxin domain-containing protein [Deltaproteobacteria bacterium]